MDAPGGPRDEHDPVRVDPGRLRQLDAVGERAQLAAERRVPQPESDEGDRGEPDERDDELRAPDSQPEDGDARGDVRARRPVLRPGDERDRVPQHVGKPEREEEELQLADPLAPDRAPEHHLEREREPRRRHDAEAGPQHEGHEQELERQADAADDLGQAFPDERGVEAHRDRSRCRLA